MVRIRSANGLHSTNAASGEAVWLDSSVRLVVDKPLSFEEVETAFAIEPHPVDCSSCLVVSREGLTSWDGWAPWARSHP